MAITLSQLQDYVDANIKQNGRNAITGNVMNYALQNTISLLSGKQDTLVSGTNIKTVNGTSLLGSGNVAITASLVVGSTAIGSGTDTRILFQSGGVLSQSAMLTFNDTGTAGSTTANFANTFNRTGNNFRIYGNNGATTLISSEGGGSGLYATSTYEIISTSGNNFNFRIGTGSPVSAMYINSSLYVGLGTTSPSSRLDIRAQGAASTDLAFRVRNSANTANIFEIRGNNIVYVDPSSTFQANGVNIMNNGFNRLEHSVALIWSGSASSIGYGCSSNQDMVTGSIGGIPIYGKINWHDQNIQLGSTAALNGRGVLSIGTNTAPTTNMVDGFRQYSADIVAGNAAPHFRTENGSIIKLYKQDLPTSPTTSEVATLLSNLGLANLI